MQAKKAAEKKLAAQKEAEAIAKAKAEKAALAAKAEADRQAALVQKKAQQEAAEKAAARAKAKAEAERKLLQGNYPGKDLGMKPIVAPALPIADSKEERLAALLQKYKADKITPEQYHQQRAAILAEP